MQGCMLVCLYLVKTVCKLTPLCVIQTLILILMLSRDGGAASRAVTGITWHLFCKSSEGLTGKFRLFLDDRPELCCVMKAAGMTYSIFVLN